MDQFLSLYCKWTSSSTYTERGIKMLQWTTWLVSRITKGKYEDVSSSLRKLYTELSMMRYVLRLYGFPTAIEGIRSGSWAGGPWEDKRIRKLGKIMAWSMAAYYPLEHLAWAKWTMPKLMPKIDANRFSAWSCRCWSVYIVAELLCSWLKIKELEKRLCILKEGSVQNNRILEDGEKSNENSVILHSIYMNKLQILRDVFFAAPCINWSMNQWATNPWLSEAWCNGLSFAEAVVCIHQSLCGLRF
mmetsp:Transcript_17139/g.32431  ORF Transcript_17139/g.32431 Transcript_17139/m.32431 type:complete len:245 (-) Transcript_17139:69-803(-)